jgi:NADH:ubiquinone oxidoreductase subunit 2 (subunit N)
MALAAFYYLRVIVYMHMRHADPDPAPIERHPFGSIALALSVAGVVLLGLSSRSRSWASCGAPPAASSN